MSNAQTEDVEEALGWLIEEARRPQGKAPRPPVVVRRRAGVVRDEIRDLRSRLEEVEGEREQWRENWRVAQGDAAHASRRADRLEEAVKHVVEELDHEIGERDLPDSALWWLGELRDRLRSALDSREDEGEWGELRIDGCICPQFVVDDNCPVHADEPVSRENELWECPVCYTVVGDDCTSERVFLCPNDDCPQTTVAKADTFRYRPTDEPVSGEDDQ